MISECIRRLTELGVPEAFINNFSSSDVVPCIDIAGDYSDLSAEDIANIAEIESLGNKVYLVVHGFYDGVLMTNYLTVSEYEEDWSSEFYESIPHCCVVFGFVKSELTKGLFDTGMLNMFCHDGFILRVTAEEAYTLSRNL